MSCLSQLHCSVLFDQCILFCICQEPARTRSTTQCRKQLCCCRLSAALRSNLISESFEGPVCCPCQDKQSEVVGSEQPQQATRADHAEVSPIDAPSAPPIAQPVPTRVAHRLSMAVVMHCAAISFRACLRTLRSSGNHAEHACRQVGQEDERSNACMNSCDTKEVRLRLLGGLASKPIMQKDPNRRGPNPKVSCAGYSLLLFTYLFARSHLAQVLRQTEFSLRQRNCPML